MNSKYLRKRKHIEPFFFFLVYKGEGMSTFTGQQDLTFEGNAASLGTCPVTVTGTVEDGNTDMTINVKVPTLQQTAKVTYSGVKQVAESGGN